MFSAFTIASRQGALDMLSQTTSRLDFLNQVSAAIGVSQARAEVAIAGARSSSETLREAQSRIVDADVAETAADQVRLQILQSTGSAVLAQANQLPSLVLNLL